MFQLLPCSVCQRTFSLRKDVPESALLKCPNCGNQFRLGDVLDHYYGPWIVVGEAAEDVPPEVHSLASRPGSESPIGAPTDARLSFDNLLKTHDDTSVGLVYRENAVTDEVAEVAADQALESADLQLPESPEDDADLLDMDSSDLVIEDSPDSNEPVAIGTHQVESPMDTYGSLPPAVKKMRVSKGDKGGLWSIVQVVLGGAAAIPVTLLLLWYVVGKDVMDAGPTIAQYLPWIVPQKFHHPRENLPPQAAGPRVPPPALGEGGFRNFDEELSKPTGTTEEASPSNEGKADSDSKPRSEPAPVPNDGSGMASTFESVRLIKDKIAAWDPNSPEKAARATEIFGDLVRLSELLSAFPATGGAMTFLKNDLNDIGRALASKESETLRRAFANLQSDQFKGKSTPTRPGRIYLGRATEVSENETQWIIALKEGVQPFQIEVSKKLITDLRSGQLFFCLGTAIENPPSPAEPGAPTILRLSATFLQTF